MAATILSTIVITASAALLLLALPEDAGVSASNVGGSGVTAADPSRYRTVKVTYTSAGGRLANRYVTVLTTRARGSNTLLIPLSELKTAINGEFGGVLPEFHVQLPAHRSPSPTSTATSTPRSRRSTSSSK